MKRGSGMEGREERSKGIEIRIADAFAIIKPTAPFKLIFFLGKKEILVACFIVRSFTSLKS